MEIPGLFPKRKPRFPAHQISSNIGRERNEVWHKGSVAGKDDSHTHSAEETRNTTIDDEKYDVRCSERRPVGKNMTDGT